MQVSMSQAVTIDFRTENTSGLLQSADSLPTAVLYRNGTSTVVSVTVTLVSTGQYRAAWTNAGYTNFDQLSLEVTAVINGDSYTAKVWEATVAEQPNNSAIAAIVGLVA
jgi:hypothetical protein